MMTISPAKSTFLIANFLTISMIFISIIQPHAAEAAPEQSTKKLGERKPFPAQKGNLFNVSKIKIKHKAYLSETPKAPPLPFSYIGQQEKNDTIKFFFTRDTKIHIVSCGDTIDNEYLIESIEGKKINFRYLPLNELQTLILP